MVEIRLLSTQAINHTHVSEESVREQSDNCVVLSSHFDSSDLQMTVRK